MHHIASPERPPMLRTMQHPAQQPRAPALALQQQQQHPAAAAAELGGIARSMLPTAAQPAAAPAHPPVSVQFSQAGQPPQQPGAAGASAPQQFHQQPMTIAQLTQGQPGAQLMYAGPGAPQQQQAAAAQHQRLAGPPPYGGPGAFLLAGQAPAQPQGAAGAGPALHPAMVGLPAPQQQAALLAMQQQQAHAHAVLQGQPGAPMAPAAGPATTVPLPLMTFGTAPQALQVGTALRLGRDLCAPWHLAVLYCAHGLPAVQPSQRSCRWRLCQAMPAPQPPPGGAVPRAATYGCPATTAAAGACWRAAAHAGAAAPAAAAAAGAAVWERGAAQRHRGVCGERAARGARWARWALGPAVNYR